MKPALLLALLATFTAARTEARVGDAMSDLKIRYGQPLDRKGTKEGGVDQCTFQYLNYRISVTLEDGRSTHEEFNRRDRRDFTLAEVQEILRDAASPGAAWKQVTATTWKQSDRTATWLQNSLVIEAKIFGQR